MSEFKSTSVKIESFKDGKVYSSPSILNVWSACASFYGVQFCVKLKAHINGVHMCVSVAGFEQCFGIGGNGCFDFEMGVARVSVCISDFSYSDGRVCFYFKIKGCVGVKIPFDGTIQKCKTFWEEHICIPLFSLTEMKIEGEDRGLNLAFLQEMSQSLEN